MQVVDWLSKQAGKLADNFNKYKFYVKHTPEHIDSSTILSLTPYTSREEEALVPCLYRWSRIKNGILSEVEEFKGNSFICEPSDVGCIIQAEVTSTDPEHSGTAYLKYGPVAIDILLKSTIQNALSTNQARFNVDLHHGDSARGCVLQITDDYIHLSHCNSSANYRFDYCLGEPLIQTYPKDATRLAIVFSQKFESETLRFLLELFKDVTLSKQENSRRQLQLDITFLNRKSKDEFLFVLKGYNAKKELKNSTLINKIEKLEIDDTNINYLLEIQSLRSDLKRLFALNTKHREEKLVYYQESCRLEQEISEIITSYTNIIEGKFKNKEQFEASFIDFQNRKDQVQANRLNKIEDENNRLKEYIREKLDANFTEEQLLPKYTPLPSQNPFTKKPFADLQVKEKYENILNHMDGDQEILIEEKGTDELIREKEKLEQKLNRSLMKIEKLEEEIEKYQKVNRSEIVGNELNRSNVSNRNNTSALEISTNKVIMEKVNLERKYARLKEENSKLKAALQTQNRPIADPTDFKDVHLKEDSLLLGKLNEGSQGREETSREITRLKGVIAQLQRSLQTWRSKAELLQSELKRQKEDHEKTKAKLQKRIADLNEQISQNRNHTDVLNRSQHLSMEMDDYNQQQNEVLKEQNTFLMNQNERLTKMCDKYKSEYKRLKEINKSPV